jgi:transposase-like protein
MSLGRPPQGVSHVDRLEGPQEVKERLRVILETLTGTCSIAEASERLGVSESRVHELRREALEGALGALLPRPAGRPAAPAREGSDREAELRCRIRDLEIDLQAALVRTELALAMPQVFERGTKKNSRGRGKRNRRKDSGTSVD